MCPKVEVARMVANTPKDSLAGKVDRLSQDQTFDWWCRPPPFCQSPYSYNFNFYR